MHLISTVYNTVVRTRECVCVREAGRVTATLSHRLFCRQDVSLVSCACEGECVAVLRPLISDSYLTFYYNYEQSFRLILCLSVCLSVSLSLRNSFH